jgi:hypothetical protein
MSARHERVVDNEALFRRINEELSQWSKKQQAEELEYYCECGNATCFERVCLTRAEYEALRAHPARFAVVPGHVIREVEHVVEKHGHRYEVVEKDDEGRAEAERTDPRRHADA